jgi:nucleotide-binding universal stress UspA family protein
MSSEHHPRRIVVGVDAAGSAENAVSVSIDLARRFEAEIELVHAVPAAGHLGHATSTEDLDAARRAVRNRLEASLPGALLEHVAAEHHLVVQAGHPAPVLLERARAGAAGLIVLGAHRRKGLLDLKGTAHVVLARADCPVWTQEGPVREVEHLLVPVDLSEESLRALAAACTWAAAFGARITALHCFVGPDFYYGHGYPVPGPTYVIDQLRDDAEAGFRRQMEGFAWGNVPHELRFLEGSPAAAILAAQDEVDLILMGTHGRTGLSSVLLGNVAAAVLREAHVPVVTMRAPGRRWLV